MHILDVLEDLSVAQRHGVLSLAEKYVQDMVSQASMPVSEKQIIKAKMVFIETLLIGWLYISDQHPDSFQDLKIYEVNRDRFIKAFGEGLGALGKFWETLDKEDEAKTGSPRPLMSGKRGVV